MQMAYSSQNCRPSSVFSQKQRCSTGLSELCYDVVYNPNTLFFNLRQRTVVKAVEGAIHQINCMQHEFQLKLRGDISKPSRNKSFDFRTRFGTILLLKLKSTFERIARLKIGFCFKNQKTPELLLPNIRTGGSFYSEQFLFGIQEQFHS